MNIGDQYTYSLKLPFKYELEEKEGTLYKLDKNLRDVFKGN